MAAYTTRSGTFRSNANYSGLYRRSIYLSVAGVDRTSSLSKRGFSVTSTVDDQRGSARVSTRFISPSIFNEIAIRNGGSNGVYLFRGRILSVTSKATNQTVDPDHTLKCADDRWLLDRYKRVTKQYRALGGNSIVADILARFTDGSFKVGSIPFSLGNVDQIDFRDELVSTAITRVIQTLGAVWVMDPERYISATATTLPDGNSLSVSTGDTGFWDLEVDEDGLQVRSRVDYIGVGSPTTSEVFPSATDIPVEDTSIFDSTGGTVRVGENLVTYTARSTNLGQGNLTGCSGVDYYIASGTTAYVFYEGNDTSAQTVIATALGGGLSGVVVDVHADSRLSLVECQGRATTDLALFSSTLKSARFTTRKEFYKPGKTISVNLTTPRAVVVTMRIQSVTMRPRGKFDTSHAEWEYAVEAGPFRRTLPALWARADGHEV